MESGEVRRMLRGDDPNPIIPRKSVDELRFQAAQKAAKERDDRIEEMTEAFLRALRRWDSEKQDKREKEKTDVGIPVADAREPGEGQEARVDG